MITLANPTNSGVANSSSMIVPCMVNSWLYCSLLTIWLPGRASSARITMAIRPPTRKNTNEVIRYRWPITLWSVLVIQRTTVLPLLRVRRAPVAPGRAAEIVTGHSPRASRCLQVADVGVVLPRGHDLDVEQHPGVVLAAELGALALVGPGLGRGDLERVRPPGDDVHLEQERRHPERVDDVVGLEAELHALALGQVPASAAWPGVPVTVVLLVAVAGVGELPGPLDAGDRDLVVGVRRDVA